MEPTSTTDFGSATFDQSLQNLKATGSNYVALVVPYYQSNTTSSDIAPGYNTPTDASLESAIDYAHSLGLAVSIKVFVEPYTGEWRAYISPSDRDTWYAAFNSVLQHVGTIAQAHHVEMIVMGTEMVSVASSAVNPDNTERWETLIANLRQIYSGKLTYDAESTNNNTDPFENEKISIGFWQQLDYVGLSVYYGLNTSDNSVQSLENQWSYWNNNDLTQFEQSVNKPILFTEIGYRSVDNAHTAPWNSSMGGNYNPTEQANDYNALMGYWNNYPWVQGVFWWDWDTNPNAGGSGDTGYTVQNKPAQQVLTQWFTNPTPPTSGGGGGTTPAAAFSITAAANPTAPAQNQNTAVSVNVTDNSGALSNGIVDVEIYNSSNTRVFQQFFDSQNIAAGQTQSYSVSWPGGTSGTYHVEVGVFTAGWAQNLSWNSSAATISVSAASTPPSNPPPSGNDVTDIWWPTSGANVTGTQPFKAMLENIDVSQYSMYWQVDGGQLNVMGNNSTDYPHKEADVDVSGWNWQPSGNYLINFVSKDSGGNILSEKSVTIHL